MTRIALLGCGTVGRAVAHRLIDEADELSSRAGNPIQLARILVRDVHRDRGVNPALLTDQFEDITNDNSIDIAIELLGGLEPARSYVERLLRRGIHVVTANKTLLAHAGPQLHDLAWRCGASLAGEASVGGASPMLSTLRGLQADEINSIVGIVSGSCNFIVTAMQRDGLSREAAIAHAQKRGLLEPDPSTDLSLRDAAEKLCVMAHTIGYELSPSQVSREGIEHLQHEDLLAARALGFSLRCVVEFDRHGARVGPALVPADHPLAHIDEEQNALLIRGRDCGELQVRGLGAGPAPTAITVLGDLVGVIRGSGFSLVQPLRLMPAPSCPARPHVLRCCTSPGDDPGEVLDRFSRAGVPITRLEWRRGWFGALTRRIRRPELDAAIRASRLASSLVFCAPCLTQPERETVGQESARTPIERSPVQTMLAV